MSNVVTDDYLWKELKIKAFAKFSKNNGLNLVQIEYDLIYYRNSTWFCNVTTTPIKSVMFYSRPFQLGEQYEGDVIVPRVESCRIETDRAQYNLTRAQTIEVLSCIFG